MKEALGLVFSMLIAVSFAQAKDTIPSEIKIAETINYMNCEKDEPTSCMLTMRGFRDHTIALTDKDSDGRFEGSLVLADEVTADLKVEWEIQIGTSLMNDGKRHSGLSVYQTVIRKGVRGPKTVSGSVWFVKDIPQMISFPGSNLAESAEHEGFFVSLQLADR